jgi:AcrR family transcriptional regulator
MPRARKLRSRDPVRESRREDRRHELLEAAVRVIRREGPSASMDVMAAEAGVTKPILYRHFGDRSGLVQAVAERFTAELTGSLQGALGREAAEAVDSPRAVLLNSIDAYLTLVEREPQLYRFLTQRAVADQPEAVQGFMRQVGQQVALVLGEQLRRAGLDSGAAEPWAYGLVGMVQLAGDWWVERRPMPRARLVEYLATLVWDGFSGIGLPAVQEGGGPRPETGTVREMARRRSGG